MTRWFLYLIPLALMQLIAWIVTPLLPVFANIRVGKSNNNTETAVEVRLPTWLSWFDTPDNSLYGDDAWLSRMGHSYWTMVMWLYRNSLYGFKWTVLSLSEGHPDAWQWHRKYYLGNYCIDLNFGWMLDNIENGVAMFHFSPRLKKV